MEASRMRALVDQLNEASYNYHTLSRPTISDAEYDALYDELLALEAGTGQTLPDSPTHRVGGPVLAAFEPHRHIARLWSMDKAQTTDALVEWIARAEKLRAQAVEGGESLPDLSFIVEHKFDGVAMCLTYEGGVLVQAASRGNGEVGEAILAQVRTIREIPLTIPFTGRMEVQGEGIMRLSVLDAYNRSAQEPLKNARNAAAGALRNLDPRVTASRALSAFFYHVGYIEGHAFEDAADMRAFLRQNGLPVAPEVGYADDFEGLLALIAREDGARDRLDFLIDGVVIKIRNMRTRELLGYTDRFPRWAVAYKFEAQEITTRLLDVTWDVGRTGKLTPLGHLDPVQLAGATVRRATLNNWGDIQRKRVRLGCRVWVRRSNEVIPEILGCVEAEPESEPDTRPVPMPERCPACGGPIEMRGAHMFCDNREGCMPQMIARLTHYASRDAMDIETFSDRTAQLLHESLGVSEPSQLYALTAEQLVPLERFGEKKAQNLLDALDRSRSKPLDAFIYALGIPTVGRKTARDLAETFGSMRALMAAERDALTAIPEVGGIVADNILAFFADGRNVGQVEALLAAGVSPAWQAQAVSEGIFFGQTLVLTGTLSAMTRSQAEKEIAARGGKLGSDVSSKTHLVIAGEAAGGKLAKAQKLNVRVIGEAEFLEMLKA